MYGCFDASRDRHQAGREPRSNPSTGENGSREGQVTPQVLDGSLQGQWVHILYVEVPNTWEKQHHRIGLSRVVIRPRYHKGEGRIAMTHCDPSVVSSRDERWGNKCGRQLGLKAEGFLQCHSTETATYPVKEGQRRGRQGSLTREPSLEGAEERTIGSFTDDRAGTSRQDRSRAVRGRWPVEQPQKKGPPSPQAHRGADTDGCSQLQAVSTQKTSTVQSVT